MLYLYLFLVICVLAFLVGFGMIFRVTTGPTWSECAWCRRWVSSAGEIRELKDVPVFSAMTESHGICKDCAAKYFGKEELAKVFIDSEIINN